MGWSRPIVEQTPLAAVVAENGAVALFRDGGELQRRVCRSRSRRATPTPFACAPSAARIVAEVPGATLARDSAGRVTDIAVDHAEFAHLDAARDRRGRRADARAKA